MKPKLLFLGLAAFVFVFANAPASSAFANPQSDDSAKLLQLEADFMKATADKGFEFIPVKAEDFYKK